MSEKHAAGVGLWENLQGHKPRLKTLVQACNENRLAGTLLFAGPSGIGKKLAALVLAQALVCETPLVQRANGANRADGAGCGMCGPCLRIEKGQSESLLLIEPESAQIKIEQARDVLRFLTLQKLGRARVVIIDQAQLLGPQAGNALLKALEEPPDGTHFILVTHLPNSILATLRSRSQLVRFMPLPDDDLVAVLTRITDASEVDEWLKRSANGSVEAAMRLLENRAEYEVLNIATSAYVAAAQLRFPNSEIAVLREHLKDRTMHGYVAGLLQRAVADALKRKSGLDVEADRRMDLWTPISTALALKSSNTLEHLARRTLDFESDLTRNVERGLLLEALAVEMKGRSESGMDRRSHTS